jgi:hypothetical protein
MLCMGIIFDLKEINNMELFLNVLIYFKSKQVGNCILNPCDF